MTALRILVAPLNWGLGHAARCLPIARALAGGAEARGLALELHWASDGQALGLLRAEWPRARHHELPGYGVRYPTKSATLNMLASAPRAFAAVVAERARVAELHARHDFHFVLSDNRYGARARGVPSAVVAHQLHLPLARAWQRGLGDAVQRALLGGFDEVVVPDYPTPPRLAGAMSAPLGRLPTRYLGPVSRFAGAAPVAGGEADTPTRYDVAAVLSGPEPARSRFERVFLAQLRRGSFGRVLLVRGVPAGAAPALDAPLAEGTELEVVDFAGARELGPVYRDTPALVTRPGYTTVMDLAAIGRRAIYVPTPGQPEQRVLAEACETSGTGVHVGQDTFNLAEALQRLGAPGAGRGFVADAAGGDPDRAEGLLATWADAALTRAERHARGGL